MHSFFPPKKFAFQFWQINLGAFFTVKTSHVVERRVREEVRRIGVTLMKAECTVFLWAVNNNKDAVLVGAGGHFLPVYKGLGWGGLVLLSTDLWEKSSLQPP